ncbi:hypothetical protein BHE74_00010924 [Ensete ventricosum]|nr:hypothetical protein BHE74_00010924 [Ensete ventricosum]
MQYRSVPPIPGEEEGEDKPGVTLLFACTIRRSCWDLQAALVGTHKGSCHLFDTSDNKLHIKNQVYLQTKKKKSSHKKITGFQFVKQFVPGSSSEVLITSADSRIRVVNGIELVHKFKGKSWQ